MYRCVVGCIGLFQAIRWQRASLNSIKNDSENSQSDSSPSTCVLKAEDENYPQSSAMQNKIKKKKAVARAKGRDIERYAYLCKRPNQ